MAQIARHWKLALIWILSLIAVSAIKSSAQSNLLILPSPEVLSGSDVGFRLERVRDGVPIGVLVVRVDGHWIAPQSR
jgi:hypothetical protein